MDADKKKLLENKIRSLVIKYINESEEKEVPKRGNDNVTKDKEYMKRYSAIVKYMSDPKVNKTQVLSKALKFSPKDDAARSHAFKQLNMEKTPDGSGIYHFDDTELNQIWSIIN